MANRVAIFGGAFDPIHEGHINCVKTVLNKFNFKKVVVVPAQLVPNKNPSSAAAKARLNMTKLAFARHSKRVDVSDVELKKKGVSYTIDTLKKLEKKFKKNELYLVIGADQFLAFDSWKNFNEILERVNLLVCSRPGSEWPLPFSKVPGAIGQMTKRKNEHTLELETGRRVHFVTLNDVDVSSTDLRKRLSKGEDVSQLIPKKVVDYIEEHELYRELAANEHEIDLADEEAFLQFCAQALYDKKGFAITAKDMRKEEGITDFALICSSTSRTHAGALANHIIRSVKEKYKLNPKAVEGQDEARWIVVDFGFTIVHVFYDFTRQEYQLEKLWQDVPEIELQLK